VAKKIYIPPLVISQNKLMRSNSQKDGMVFPRLYFHDVFSILSHHPTFRYLCGVASLSAILMRMVRETIFGGCFPWKKTYQIPSSNQTWKSII